MTSLLRPPVRLLVVAATLVAAGSATYAMRPQEPTLSAERVVDFKVGTAIPITAKVGAVSVQTVEFSDRGRPGPGGIGGIMRSAVSDTSTVLRAHLLAENATAAEWQVTFTFEFLDRSGKVIDRASKKSSWEGQAKPTDLDHPILQYVVPAIAQVRIKMEAKLD